MNMVFLYLASGVVVGVLGGIFLVSSIRCCCRSFRRHFPCIIFL